jgi:hypothetical protein
MSGGGFRASAVGAVSGSVAVTSAVAVSVDGALPGSVAVSGGVAALGGGFRASGGGAVSGGAAVASSATVRHAAVDAPILLLAYGLLRLIDGLDGTYGESLAWNLAHLALFASMVLFGVLATAVRPLVPAGARPLAALAAVATVAGTACFLWTATGLLSTAFGEATPVPAPLRIAGPLLFSLGMLTLLGLLVAAGHAPAWSPLLFGAGIAATLIDADSLPAGALILLAALAPLARPAEARPAEARPAEARPAEARPAQGRPATGRIATGRPVGRTENRRVRQPRAVPPTA